jgi:hypothetical protein
MHVRGPFEVKMTPQEHSDKSEGSLLGRIALDKHYRGDLDAVGKGEMLTAGTAVKGSAVYVAIERVTGTLDGRSGGFAIVHHGTMTRGVPTLSIAIVPDSGTGELVGIRGTMQIDIVQGTHFYELDYAFDVSSD